MKLATVCVEDREVAAFVLNGQVLLIEDANQHFQTNWETTVFDIIQKEQLNELTTWFNDHLLNNTSLVENNLTPVSEVQFGPLYRHPRKIWGIGLNYVEHAADLSEKAPNTEPASFLKPDTTIIAPGDEIQIPLQSERTTAESELGIIIGKKIKDVTEEEAPFVIAGYTTIIDMTAEDILQVNPRYLTRAKSFDTFFSFGPCLITPDEVEDVNALNVATVINGEVHRSNIVSNMTFKPWHLVSFHSKVMTLLPGDIISTGTPGAVVINEGDIVECHIDGFPRLVNPVKDLKVSRVVEVI
ncbi:MAG TPA: fumarylacetoacetate hydrolase family protein [Ureibacillus sp.]|nr:fumarylacetoacetate hydrolase family protein [Ureibacillus sp.]